MQERKECRWLPDPLWRGPCATSKFEDCDMNRPIEKYVEEGAYPDAHHPRKKRRAPALPSGTRPRVLLLQGPVGPFFRHLQQHLEDSGFDAWRICRSEEHTSELQSLMRISYAVFCLK